MPLNLNSNEAMEKLPILILNEFQLDKTKEETFSSVCKALDQPNVPPENVQLWFQQFRDKNLEFDSGMETDYLRLIEIIEEKFFIYKNAIFENEKHGDEWRFVPTNTRYAFKCNELHGELKGLLVFDYFHGLQKEIPLSSGSIKAKEHYPLFEPITIDLNHVLVLERCTEANLLHLLEIDNKNETCKLLNSTKIRVTRFSNMNFIFDQKDRNKMVIVSEINGDDENPNDPVVAIDLTNNTVKAKSLSYKDLFDLYTNCYRVRDNVLSGLIGKEEDEIYTLHSDYWTMDLKANRLQLNQQFEFVFPLHIDFSDLWVETNCYSWLDNTCFMAVKNEDSESSSICVFDVETQKCSLINCNYPIIKKMLIDETDENLTIWADGAMYKRSLKKPESLQNIAWFNIRRQTLFHKNDLYSKALKQLPLNCKLQPFYNLK